MGKHVSRKQTRVGDSTTRDILEEPHPFGSGTAGPLSLSHPWTARNSRASETYGKGRVVVGYDPPPLPTFEARLGVGRKGPQGDVPLGGRRFAQPL